MLCMQRKTQKLLRPKLCYHAKLQRKLLSGWQAQKLEPRWQSTKLKLIQGQAVGREKLPFSSPQVTVSQRPNEVGSLPENMCERITNPGCLDPTRVVFHSSMGIYVLDDRNLGKR